MIAGRMKYRLELYRPVTRKNPYGEIESTYRKTVTVHAERVKQTGRRRIDMDEVFADYTTEFNIRDIHEIDEGWRVQQLGGYLYSVTNIIPNLDKGFKTLVCDRVNE